MKDKILLISIFLLTFSMNVNSAASYDKEQKTDHGEEASIKRSIDQTIQSIETQEGLLQAAKSCPRSLSISRNPVALLGVFFMTRKREKRLALERQRLKTCEQRLLEIQTQNH